MELCPDLGSCCRFELTPAVLREAVRPDWDRASQALQALLTAVADIHMVGCLCFQCVDHACSLCCLDLASSCHESLHLRCSRLLLQALFVLWGFACCLAHCR